MGACQACGTMLTEDNISTVTEVACEECEPGKPLQYASGKGGPQGAGAWPPGRSADVAEGS